MSETNNIPRFIEGERSVLGAMLLSNYALVRAAGSLCPDDFYSESHRIAFEAMVGIQKAGKPVDWVTLTKSLNDSGNLQRVGGLEFLTSLSDAVPSAANIDHYIKIVREKGLLRRTVFLCREAIAKASSPNADLMEVIRDHFSGMVKLEGSRQQESDKKLVHIKEVVASCLEKTMECRESGKAPGIPTGFRDLDDMTGGFQPADLIVIAGRPSMGKSALAFQVSHNVSKSVPVAVFSVEMGRTQYGQRYLSRQAKINLLRIRTGQVNDSEVSRLVECMGDAEDTQEYVDFTPAITPAHIRLKVQEAEIRLNLRFGMILADFMQLMKSTTSSGSREQDVAMISQDLKAIAKDFNVPVVALAQLNREVEKRTNKRPILSDLRESGSIEQDGDLIIAVHREAKYSDKADPNAAELIVLKQRNGPVGTVNAFWSPETSTFHNWEI